MPGDGEKPSTGFSRSDCWLQAKDLLFRRIDFPQGSRTCSKAREKVKPTKNRPNRASNSSKYCSTDRFDCQGALLFVPEDLSRAMADNKLKKHTPMTGSR